MSAAAAATDIARLLDIVQDAQHRLTQLEATAKGLVDELASAGAAAMPRLRELLAAADRLVAAVQAAGSELAPRLPAGSALPAAPNHAAVEAVWARQLQPEREPTVVPIPVARPAASLQDLAASLAALPACRLQLLRGRTPAQQSGEATAVLLRCGRAFAAVVHLQRPGGMEPLRVGVLSAAEADAALSDGSGGDSSSSSLLCAGGRSLWAPSQHAVFQQLSAHATGALEHFLQQAQRAQQAQQGQAAASPLELLLLWLATCGDLISRPSGSAGGGLLLADTVATGGGAVLPLRRPYQLGWEQLWTAALNPHLRRAEPTAEAGD
ncbi:hypothetical protein ABPG75_011451 [Micractinium tetrahymenae]